MCSNILDINFTFVSRPCKCVRLLIMTSFLGKYFFDKKELNFLVEHFYEKLSNFTIFRVNLLQIHFGTGAARIQNYFSGSGSC